jgi:hypothetical protein
MLCKQKARYSHAHEIFYLRKVCMSVFSVLLVVGHLLGVVEVMAAEESLASTAASILTAVERLDDLAILRAGDRLVAATATAREVPREVPIALAV